MDDGRWTMEVEEGSYCHLPDEYLNGHGLTALLDAREEVGIWWRE